MRYKEGYRQERRRELLRAAGGAVKKNGYAATGVDALMKAAGVTSGAFYSHFASKPDFLKAMVVNELERSRALWAKNGTTDRAAWVKAEAERYLTMAHLDHPESGCVLPALTAEIARADDEIRAAFAAELTKAKEDIAEKLGTGADAWAFLSQIVGGVLLASAMPDRRLQEEILAASRRAIGETAADQVGRRPV